MALTVDELHACLVEAGVPTMLTERTAADLARGLGLPLPVGGRTPGDRLVMRSDLVHDLARRMRAEEARG